MGAPPACARLPRRLQLRGLQRRLPADAAAHRGRPRAQERAVARRGSAAALGSESECNDAAPGIATAAKPSDARTRGVRLQIILEEESGGVPMFSSQMLAQIIRFYGHAMQGMMGSYLEKNLQTFTDIQAKLAEQAKGLYDPKVMSPELWTQFLNGQAPAVQGRMGNYLEQSKA